MCILYMAVVLNSCICKRPFFANKKNTFVNLSRTPRLSFARVSYYSVSLNPSPKKKVTVANSKKDRRVSWWTLAALAIKTLTQPFRTTPTHTHIYIHWIVLYFLLNNHIINAEPLPMPLRVHAPKIWSTLQTTQENPSVTLAKAPGWNSPTLAGVQPNNGPWHHNGEHPSSDCKKGGKMEWLSLPLFYDYITLYPDQ